MVEIERAAEAFLAGIPSYVWDGTTLPVPIEEIADTYVGLLVRDVEDLGTAPGAPELGHGQALSGLLLPAVGEIWVNGEEARQWPARRRFTIAHELGHWRLHRDAERGVFCRSGSIEPGQPQARVPRKPLTEDQLKGHGEADGCHELETCRQDEPRWSSVCQPRTDLGGA